MKELPDILFHDTSSALAYLKKQTDPDRNSIWQLRGGIGAGMKYFNIRWLSIGELTEIENNIRELLSQICIYRNLLPTRSATRMRLAKLSFWAAKQASLEYDDTFEDMCNSINLENRLIRCLEEVQKQRKALSPPYRS